MSKFTGDFWYWHPGDNSAGIDGHITIWAGHEYPAPDVLVAAINMQPRQARTNARLIAAAPEMYELLYEAMQELKGYKPIENGISTIWLDIEELLNRIK